MFAMITNPLPGIQFMTKKYLSVLQLVLSLLKPYNPLQLSHVCFPSIYIFLLQSLVCYQCIAEVSQVFCGQISNYKYV